MRTLLCVTLAVALGGCGGSGNHGGGGGGSGGGGSCAVSISGAPTSGTYITCLVGAADANGYASLQGQEIPGCDGCSFTAAINTTGTAMCAAGSGDHAGLDVTDNWPNAFVGSAQTANPPPADANLPATPCTVVTNSYSPQSAANGGTGHWSGTIDATVFTVNGSGAPVDTTMVHISGSF